MEEKQIEGLVYEKDKISKVLKALDVLTVRGHAQADALSFIYEILKHPLPAKEVNDINE